MKTPSEMIKSILRITGLTLVIIVISGTILYVRFGPEAEVDPTFLRKSMGIFIKIPSVDTSNEPILAHWTIPVLCQVNGVEVQKDGEDGWLIAEANCAQGDAGVTCLSNLTLLSLPKAATYHLQTHHAQCSDDNLYVSTVTDFSL